MSGALRVELGLQNRNFRGQENTPYIAPWKKVQFVKDAGDAVKVPCDLPESGGFAVELTGVDVGVEQEVSCEGQAIGGELLYATARGMALGAALSATLWVLVIGAIAAMHP